MIHKRANSNDEVLRAFAAGELGSKVSIDDQSRAYGRRSTTWRVTTDDGAAYYLKQHEHRRHFETELLAYSTWVPKLDDPDCWYSPELVGFSSELGALILTEVSGEILEESETSPDERLEMHRIAGWLAAQIHQLDVDAAEAGPTRLYDPALLNFYIERAVPYLDSATLRWAERIAAEDKLFDGLSVVPTHADFSPRNWLINRTDHTISLGLIDWERARAGYWLEDGHRLAFDHWLLEPNLRGAYFDGYGRTPTVMEERQLKLICLANALGTVSWATEHDDTAFANFGRRTLSLLKDELS